MSAQERFFQKVPRTSGVTLMVFVEICKLLGRLRMIFIEFCEFWDVIGKIGMICYVRYVTIVSPPNLVTVPKYETNELALPGNQGENHGALCTLRLSFKWIKGKKIRAGHNIFPFYPELLKEKSDFS